MELRDVFTWGGVALGLAAVALAIREAQPRAVPRPNGCGLRRGPWCFDHYPDSGELRAYIDRPSPSEQWAGDYSVGRYSAGEAPRAAARWADHHRRTGQLPRRPV